MFVIKLHQPFTGLCNQILALVSGLIEAKRRKINTVYICSFLTNVNTNNTVPIDKIIDLRETSKKVGLTLLVAPDNANGQFIFKWYTQHNPNQFLEILKAITWHPKITTIVDYLKNTYLQVEKLNVVHFRIEKDSIDHWAKINKINATQWKETIYNKYYNLIRYNIPENSAILALSYTCDDPLFQDLAKYYQIYNFNTSDSLLEHLGFTGREVCALVDLLLGIQCNGTFIGCYNFTKERGSTFSYTLWQLMNSVQKGIFIDLDYIKGGEEIMYKNIQENNNIYIYMHICTINNWAHVVEKIYNKIIKSGLIEKISGFKVVVLGNELEAVKNIMNHPQVEIIFHSQDTSFYERKCLELLHAHAWQENFRVLYLHSKGVTQNNHLKDNVADWVDLMLYFNVDLHHRCLQLLNTHDTCGVNLYDIFPFATTYKGPFLTHYSGNFWWANSNYIRKLPPKIGEKYLDPEFWIGLGKKKNMACLWKSNIAHYFNRYSPSNYIGKESLSNKN